MPKVKANGIELEYESRGDPKNETILLIMGLGAQMTRWPQALIDRLVAGGYRVVWFDNRDVGLSEKIDHAGAPDFGAVLGAVQKGEKPPIAYDLSDMAADAAGLLDALGIERAHIVGASMGGMIAQFVAIEHPEKVLSLTSIMSTTGHPDLDRATPEAMEVLSIRPPSLEEDREGFLAHAVRSARVIGSPGYPPDEAETRANALAYAERCTYPVGFSRQYAAIMGSPQRRDRLASVKVPTVVIHGENDPLVPVSGGRDTAKAVAGAELVTISGMGHDIPAPLIGQIADAILRAASRAQTEVA